MKNSLRKPTIKDAGKYLFVFLFVFLVFSPEAKAQSSPSRGETFKYAIKKFGVKVGEATLKLEEDPAYPQAYVVVFQAKAPNLYDEERIYVDRQSFYPVMVKRDLDIFGKKEKIEEVYGAQKGEIRIIKEVKGEKTEQVIQREGRIDNIYCFLYRFRLGLQSGKSFQLNLPTKTVEIKITKEDKISVMDKQFEAFYFESDPKQYKLWLDKSPQRMPLRIDGAMGLISTSLILTEYQP